MWSGHLAIFGLPAILFPFTFMQKPGLNNMYLSICIYLSTIFGALWAVLDIALFFVSAVNYLPEQHLSHWVPYAEAVIYAVFVIGGFATVVQMTPLAAIYITKDQTPEVVEDLLVDEDGMAIE